jgi:hypothetical protein
MPKKTEFEPKEKPIEILKKNQLNLRQKEKQVFCANDFTHAASNSVHFDIGSSYAHTL